ncbi:hypothetical protein AgCh_027250 [Apium graveolens]
MKVNGGAIEAMKPLLGNYYQYDGTPILKAMYREMKESIYVEKDEDLEKTLRNPPIENEGEKERVNISLRSPDLENEAQIFGRPKSLEKKSENERVRKSERREGK